MSVVLAALDSSDGARVVLDAASRFGQLTGAGVEAVSVRSEVVGPAVAPESLAATGGVPFRLLEGPVASSLLGALGAPEVIAAVIGARARPGGRRPVGQTAHEILASARKPVVVVPLEVSVPGAFSRLLIPLEGTESSSVAVLERLCPLLVTAVELVVLHAFTEATVPAMLDRPAYDLDTLGKEFLDRNCPYSTRVEFCAGPVAKRVAEASREHDLVVLSWSQDSSPGRARTVREVLDASAVPVLLLPAEPFDAGAPGSLYASSSRT
jgi:nucleotide-binding universal stress UspA family protein